MDHKLAGKNTQMQLAKLEEWREKAYHSAKIYKDRTKRWHDKRIKPKEFKLGDKVLMFNSRVKLFGEGKLCSKWKGPYTVNNTSSHGAITLQDNDGEYFKVNGHRLKLFYEPFRPGEVFDEIKLVDFDSMHLLLRNETRAPLDHLAHNLKSPHEKIEAQPSPEGGRPNLGAGRPHLVAVGAGSLNLNSPTSLFKFPCVETPNFGRFGTILILFFL
jgi:hypothetical protein